MLPPELQALKDAAARVQAESKEIASDDRERHWQALLAVAAEQLAPVWQWVCLDRQGRFTAQTHEYELRVALPGHRLMWARFQHGACGWSRWYYAVGTFEVESGRAWWMVERAPGKDLPTYHDTLGAALLAAEVAS